MCIKPTDTFKFETDFIQIWSLLEKIIQIEHKLQIPFCCNKETQRNETNLLKFEQQFINNNNNVKIKKLKSDQWGVEVCQQFQVTY